MLGCTELLPAAAAVVVVVVVVAVVVVVIINNNNNNNTNTYVRSKTTNANAKTNQDKLHEFRSTKIKISFYSMNVISFRGEAKQTATANLIFVLMKNWKQKSKCLSSVYYIKM